ncbi:hypothetical protein ACLOJK_020003 [Asimina triloba]
MSQSISNYSTGGSSVGGGNGFVDFHIPDEILAVIPTDPYDQLDLARKITSMAIASRVTRLEAETGRLRQKLADRDRTIYELQETIGQLEMACRDANDRLRAALDENVNLANERDSLASTAKSLNRDLVKQAETVERPCDQSALRESSIKVSSHVGQRFSTSPYIAPRLTPTGTPKLISTSGSPRGVSTAVSPKLTPACTSPTKSHFDGRSLLSSWYPSSQQSSRPSSPPQGRSRLSYEQFGAFLANIKELNTQKQSREGYYLLFIPVVTKLTLQQLYKATFGIFKLLNEGITHLINQLPPTIRKAPFWVSHLKDLGGRLVYISNQLKFSTNETLTKAEEIFGMENKDLYLSFQGLLNRSLS